MFNFERKRNNLKGFLVNSIQKCLEMCEQFILLSINFWEILHLFHVWTFTLSTLDMTDMIFPITLFLSPLSILAVWFNANASSILDVVLMMDVNMVSDMTMLSTSKQCSSAKVDNSKRSAPTDMASAESCGIRKDNITFNYTVHRNNKMH